MYFLEWQYLVQYFVIDRHDANLNKTVYAADALLENLILPKPRYRKYWTLWNPFFPETSETRKIGKSLFWSLLWQRKRKRERRTERERSGCNILFCSLGLLNFERRERGLNEKSKTASEQKKKKEKCTFSYAQFPHLPISFCEAILCTYFFASSLSISWLTLLTLIKYVFSAIFRQLEISFENAIFEQLRMYACETFRFVYAKN